MRKYLTMAVAFLATLSLIGALSQARTEDDTIKKVMKAAMKKGGLCGKVAKGEATDAQKKELLDLFEAMAKATPPKGEAADWKTRTEKLVKAAQACVDGKDDGTTQLKSAANCKACHEAHKGE